MCLMVHHIALGAAPPPLDYLVPPPRPAVASLPSAATRLHSAVRPVNSLPSESRTVPHYAFPNSQAFAKTVSEPGLISRMARWFGFANENYSQDPQASAAASTNNHLYYYPKPQQHSSGSKEPCNLCNKYPWVPMMHNSVQYPWDPSKQQPQLYKQQAVPQLQHAASSVVKQRAVQFHYPPAGPSVSSHTGQSVPPQVASNGGAGQHSPNQLQYSSGPFIPIPIPNLSNSAQLPIYNARPFHQPSSGQSTQFTAQTHHHQQHQPTIPTSSPPIHQQLPSTEAAHFTDSIASAHSEIHLDTVIPTQIPPTTQNNDASFEIIKSHQVADYVSSVEYPASFVQTQAFDIQSTSSSLPRDQQSDTKPVVNTGRYQHSTLSPYLNQHIPASQILTEPGSFVIDNQYQPSTTYPTQSYEQSTTIYESQDQGYDLDNFVAASVKNNSIHTDGNAYDSWTLESNDFVYATTTPEVYINTEAETTTTIRPDFYSSTESPQSNDVEFIASVQTSKQTSSTKLWPQKPRDRETPKRMLDSPIQHLGGGLAQPRPFTRDPADLGLRVGAKNHKFNEQAGYQQNSVSPASPTPTSTYSSIDASGHYAGMSPPALPTQGNRQPPFIPFTTKVQPRPFEPTKNITTKPPATPSFADWIQAQNSDLHTPAETMLVNVKLNPITTTTVKPRPTKYLTKILASNLRELLQREHTPSTKLKQSPNSLNFDLQTLQKNIDDWTEQEYTSLSHRPSTPTILGRSKHIPKEYLPSTATTVTTTKPTVKPQRQSKTTKGFLDTSELSASVNSLEPLYERKHFQFTAINDNHLQNAYDDGQEVSRHKTTTITPPSTHPTTTTVAPTTTPTTSSSYSTTTTRKPYYQQDVEEVEPEELWRKAKVSISPKTKEKVYVVTPQPVFFPQRQISSTSTTTTERPFSGFGSGFKSPRFLVRPTPGNVTASNLLKILGTDNSSKGKYRFDLSQEVFSNAFFLPDHVGLRGLSAYVPSEPVEIIDGNSKVKHFKAN
ncbi:mucin-2 [Musca vetustissima]|uniref:mucin-2 n=1 Tax=Musca vetustissima TaxID=27455 RepID=UPI002AB69B9C|nr:mucin-2 [Musca vetustissima]